MYEYQLHHSSQTPFWIQEQFLGSRQMNGVQ